MKLIITEKRQLQEILQNLKVRQNRMVISKAMAILLWHSAILSSFVSRMIPSSLNSGIRRLPIIPDSFKAIKNSIQQYNIVKSICQRTDI